MGIYATVQTLDVAWREAEAALPEGWSVDGIVDVSSAPARGQSWEATAKSSYIVIGSAVSIDDLFEAVKKNRSNDVTLTLTGELGGAAAYESRHLSAIRSTPAAALYALAELLRDGASR